ncbi:MAG: Spy/CpxP family protein refolding chaperone [Alphaproteobacteria bacterium]
MSTDHETTTNAAKSTWCKRWGRRALFAGGLATVLVSAAAIAHPGHGGFGGGRDLESSQEWAELATRQMLRKIDATPEQQSKINAIVLAAVKDIYPLREQAHAMRRDAMKLMAAPTVDRAAAERLRMQQNTLHEQISKRMMLAMLDAAEVLTPQQRETLAKTMAERHHHGPM